MTLRHRRVIEIILKSVKVEQISKGRKFLSAAITLYTTWGCQRLFILKKSQSWKIAIFIWATYSMLQIFKTKVWIWIFYWICFTCLKINLFQNPYNFYALLLNLTTRGYEYCMIFPDFSSITFTILKHS